MVVLDGVGCRRYSMEVAAACVVSDYASRGRKAGSSYVENGRTWLYLINLLLNHKCRKTTTPSLKPPHHPLLLNHLNHPLSKAYSRSRLPNLPSPKKTPLLTSSTSSSTPHPLHLSHPPPPPKVLSVRARTFSTKSNDLFSLVYQRAHTYFWTAGSFRSII